ncbi:AsmA family protein [Ancylobacter sp. TS-1]|uniref:AsmA family protein n=1 Tax=Ancylobacter sp. TS-1 TaxID=1850374 RepID=UPI001265C773|nr:AsmA family protein [Ancylobacter sp. TS-1]QFR33354.1 AsmA family protein [Ancylobacter sp. TS-1]
MQNLLLTIASAVILAVAAAFAAPFVVDWTQWRSVFEAQAARTLGAPVLIRGPIDASILPTPRLVLRDVSIGVDGGGTGLVIAELSGRLSLGGLLRGEVVAEQLTLLRPRARLVVDATGKVALPTGAVRPRGFSVAELTLVDGSAELIDRANGRALKLDDVDLTGDIGGASGPLRLEGEVENGGVRRKLRLSLAAFAADGTAKARLGVQNVGSPFTIDADGSFSLAGGKPGFRGHAALARANDPAAALRGGDGQPPKAAAAPELLKGWSLAGTVEASAQAVTASELSLTLESAQRPVELLGTARLTGASQTQPESRLELQLSARQVDLNAVTGGAAPLAALDALVHTVAPLASVAATGTLDLSSDTVLLSGAPLREVKAGLDWSAAGWRARSLQARLPGGARAQLSGSLPSVTATADDPARTLFGGTVLLEAQDLPAFAAWAAPEARSLVVGLPPGAARLSADINIAAGRIALDKLDVTAGEGSFAGTAAYTLPAAGVRPRFDAVLSTSAVDLDTLLPTARRLVGFGMGQIDLGLSLSGRQVRFAGASAASVDLILKGGTGGLVIERLAIDDFAGLDLTGSGRLAALGDPDATGAGADGRFEAQLSGPRADGLPALARAFGLPQAESALTRAGAALAPVDLRLVIASQAGRTSLDAGGRLGMLTGAGRLGFGAGRPLDGRVQLDATDGSAVLAKLGVPGLRPALGPGRLVVEFGDRLDARLTLAGASLNARGTLGQDAEGRLQPDLSLALDGADLAALLPDIAASGARSVPASFKGALGRDGQTWWVRGLSGSIAGQKLDGGIGYVPGQPVELDLTTAEWSASRALGLAVGAAAGGGEGWPRGRFGPPALGTLAMNVKLGIGRLDLPGDLSLGDAKVQARLSGGRLSVEDFSGALAGGKLAGRFNLGRLGDAVQFDGRLSLTDADSTLLLAGADVKKPGVRAKVSTTLDLAGRGNSPFALASQLQGQGSVAVEGLEIEYNDPTALQYVMLATDRGLPPDQKRVVQLLNAGLSRGPLRLARAESAVSVVDGVARTSTARLALGDQRFGLSGYLDIPALSFEATLEMQDVGTEGLPAAPAAAVQWRGALSAPERRFDITALITAINMRALDRETKRLEAEYGRTPLTNGGQTTDAPPVQPALPSYVPQTVPRLPAQQAAPQQSAPRQAPAQAAQPRPAAPQSYYGQYSPPGGAAPGSLAPGSLAPGSAAPPLAPPVDIPVDPLRSPIMAPPLAP